MTDLKCPYCDFKISVHIPDNAPPEEVKMLKECPCGKAMETAQEIKSRMAKRGIRAKRFYTMINRYETGIIAEQKEGIEFDKCGVRLYAYQADVDYPMCYVIDPETGLSLLTVYHPLDVVYRHISHARIEEFKNERLKEKEYYAERKKKFRDAKMWAG